MVVDVDRCTGCQACVLACQVENNVPLNTENLYKQKRIYAWIRVERYWEGEFPDVKARFIPILCQQCGNAPCEPVCPVFATYHNNEGMNVQVYNRCVGTRYCANGCPYHVRFFNYWEPVWPERLRNQLNPDVTVRSRGVMEKCSFCIQRIRRAELTVERQDRSTLDHQTMKERNLLPACRVGSKSSLSRRSTVRSSAPFNSNSTADVSSGWFQDLYCRADVIGSECKAVCAQNKVSQPMGQSPPHLEWTL